MFYLNQLIDSDKETQTSFIRTTFKFAASAYKASILRKALKDIFKNSIIQLDTLTTHEVRIEVFPNTLITSTKMDFYETINIIKNRIQANILNKLMPFHDNEYYLGALNRSVILISKDKASVEIDYNKGTNLFSIYLKNINGQRFYLSPFSHNLETTPNTVKNFQFTEDASQNMFKPCYIIASLEGVPIILSNYYIACGNVILNLNHLFLAHREEPDLNYKFTIKDDFKNIGEAVHKYFPSEKITSEGHPLLDGTFHINKKGIVNPLRTLYSLRDIYYSYFPYALNGAEASLTKMYRDFVQQDASYQDLLKEDVDIFKSILNSMYEFNILKQLENSLRGEAPNENDRIH